MGWWKTGLADDVLGDDVADVTTQLCKDINTLYRSHEQVPPDFGQFLASLMHCLHQALHPSNPPNPTAISTLCASFHDSEEIACNTKRPDVLADELEALLTERLAAMATLYQADLDRQPRLTEVLSSFAFALGYRPEDYLSAMEGRSVSKIKAGYVLADELEE